ncbi:DUF1146 family protein [Evansella cellulosilytica]|uniref:DUF1146 domain-containing protein n=1 Tax=Evansella cellulosilytica (strain ATCC 21833 / DSM 2522 / FERM P-1141 / JCM 9156 / N-4) TaxID=649639 RepID=E6TX89_EVAC2|nr:DUF1146 family protein [Evansella cellulosilytica]ADU32284.1 Conserved hypothetical protein, integral membrane YwzB [Evansella cellulosilytica DSM 2522]
MLEEIGQQALLNITVSLMVLIVVWKSLSSFKLDIFFTDPDSPKAKTLVILVAIALTYLVSSFLLNYLNWAMNLRFLF